MAADDNLHPQQFKLGKAQASVLNDIAAGGSEHMAAVWGDERITHVPMHEKAARAIGNAWDSNRESLSYSDGEKRALASVYTKVHHLDPDATPDYVAAAYRKAGKKPS